MGGPDKSTAVWWWWWWQVQDDLQQVNRHLRGRASALLSDDLTLPQTHDVLDRLRASKVNGHRATLSPVTSIHLTTHLAAS